MMGRSQNITLAMKVLAVLTLVTVGLVGAAPQGVSAQGRGQGEGPQDKGAAQQEDPCVEKAKKAQQEAKAEEEQAAKDEKNAKTDKARDEAKKRKQGAQRKGNAARKAEELCKKGGAGKVDAESILGSLNEIAGARDEMKDGGATEEMIDTWLEQLNEAARGSGGIPVDKFFTEVARTILRQYGKVDSPEDPRYNQKLAKWETYLKHLFFGEGEVK